MPTLTSPIAGKVMAIQVAVGDKVEVDDELVILEAIKMETPIYAEDAGIVAAIKVKEGDAVKVGDALMVID